MILIILHLKYQSVNLIQKVEKIILKQKNNPSHLLAVFQKISTEQPEILRCVE